MQTYAILKNNDVYVPQRFANQRGFFRYELDKAMAEIGNENTQIICIEDEVEKYKLFDRDSNIWNLDSEVYSFKLWNDSFNDRNIKGFSTPFRVETNSEYCIELKEKLHLFYAQLQRPPFVYDNELLDSVNDIIEEIISFTDGVLQNDMQMVDTATGNVISELMDNSFFVSELDKSYAFRGMAPFVSRNNHNDAIEKMNSQPLSFFRVRTVDFNENRITHVNEMLHLPYSLRDKAKNMRFTKAGHPGLYLGTTSYVCSKECKWNPETEKMYCSAFVPNDVGKKFIIMNLAISQALINGIGTAGEDKDWRLQRLMLKVFPLVIATSFDVTGEEPYCNYLFSQKLMTVMKGFGIDGIAYLSMKGKDEFQYPHGVNIVISVDDIDEAMEYSKVCDAFKVGKPIEFSNQNGGNEKSYINTVFPEYLLDKVEYFTAKVEIDGEWQYYGSSKFGKYDDYVISNM